MPKQGNETVDKNGNTIHVVDAWYKIPFDKAGGPERNKQIYIYKNYTFLATQKAVDKRTKVVYTWTEAIADIKKEEAIQQKLTPKPGKEIKDANGNTIHVVTKLTDIPFGKLNGPERKKQFYEYRTYRFSEGNHAVNIITLTSYTWSGALAEIKKEDAVQQRLKPTP